MHEMRPRLRPPLLVGVGAAFDFHAGLVSQAPPWMQRNGLEWTYRLSREPRRLWRRYARYNPLFVAGFARQYARYRATAARGPAAGAAHEPCADHRWRRARSAPPSSGACSPTRPTTCASPTSAPRRSGCARAARSTAATCARRAAGARRPSNGLLAGDPPGRATHAPRRPSAAAARRTRADRVSKHALHNAVIRRGARAAAWSASCTSPRRWCSSAPSCSRRPRTTCAQCPVAAVRRRLRAG